MNWELVLTFIGGLITTAIPMFFTMRKQKAEAVTNEIDNAQKIVGMWREMVADIKQQLDKSEEDNNRLIDELKKIREDYASVLKELHALRLDYSKLEKNYKELKKELQG
jgi:uncharacterized protein (DUF3084 family)